MYLIYNNYLILQIDEIATHTRSNIIHQINLKCPANCKTNIWNEKYSIFNSTVTTHTGCGPPGLGDADHEAEARGDDEADAGEAGGDQHWCQKPRGEQVQGQRAVGSEVRNYRDLQEKYTKYTYI